MTARDAAAEAFYAMDSAQRDTRVRVDAFTSLAAGSASATRARDEFDQINGWADDAARAYIDALDAHPLDNSPSPGAYSAAVEALLAVTKPMQVATANFGRFSRRFADELHRVERELAAVPARVAAARKTLDDARAAVGRLAASGLSSPAAGAALASAEDAAEVLGRGAAVLGIAGTLRQAEQVVTLAQRAQALAEDAPRQRDAVARRLISLRTRLEAVENRAQGLDAVLSELRRVYAAGCSSDLAGTSKTVARSLSTAHARLSEAQATSTAQDWETAGAQLRTVVAALDEADTGVRAVADRRRDLAEVAADPGPRLAAARFAVRDAQRLVMAGRDVAPQPEGAALDALVVRLDAAGDRLTGTHPDYRSFLQELAAVTETARFIVTRIRHERGGQR